MAIDNNTISRVRSTDFISLAYGQWKVYDVAIDDVNLVGNYRSQFARILQTASLEEVIQKLRAKAAGR